MGRRLHDLIDSAPMSRAQIIAVLVTVALSALDGFDVLSVTFAAPGLRAEFGIDRAVLGLVLSAGLVGMALGSLLLAPWADRVGRKALVLVSLALMAAGMLASAFAPDVALLGAWRVVTGCGIGAMVAVINPLAAELANARRRDLAVGMMTVGYPIGGLLGGLIAVYLLEHFGWRAVFLLGAAAALALLPLVLACLPESIAYLERRGDPKALARAEAILRRWGHAVLPPAGIAAAAVAPPASVRALFSAALWRRTVSLIAANFLFVITTYFFLSWLPQFVADAGFSAAAATGVAVGANLAGVVGGLLLGGFAPRLGGVRVAVVALAGTGLATMAFGTLPPDLEVLRLMAGVTGFFLFGGVVGLYAIIASAFPVELRATGAGLVIGIGRGGSALSPMIAGFLLAAGVERGGVTLVMGACAVLAAVILATLPAVIRPLGKLSSGLERP